MATSELAIMPWCCGLGERVEEWEASLNDRVGDSAVRVVAIWVSQACRTRLLRISPAALWVSVGLQGDMHLL